MSGAFLIDDLPTLFGTDDFAVAITYTPAGGSPTSVLGIFDNDDLELDAGDGNIIMQNQAKLMVASSDVPLIAEGDAFVVNGVNYTSSYHKADGTGVTEIWLEVV